MDSLKENHLGTLILLVISLSGLTFYAIAETIHRQPWGTLCAFLGFGAFVCFMCLMPLLHRRISLYRIGRDLETQRSQESFSLDQSNSTSLIDITCRLQTCRKRTNIKLILTSILTVACIGGTALTHPLAQSAVAANQAAQAAKAREEAQRVEQAIKTEQEAEAQFLEKIELERINIQTELEKSLMANLTATPLDKTDQIVTDVRECKKNPKKCFRDKEDGTSDLMYDYNFHLIRYEWALSNLTVNKLDELIQSNASFSNNKTRISDLQNEWLQKIDQHFIDLYHSGFFQDTYKQTPFMKYLYSHIKDERVREVVALIWYITRLKQEYSNAAAKYKYRTIPFKSNFNTEFDGKYKDEDFDGPKAVRYSLF